MQALAFVAGPVVWLVGLMAAVMVVALYGWSLDGYIPLMIAIYLGSLAGAFFAFASMRKLRPGIGEATAYAVVAAFALLWLGYATADAIGTENLTYRLASLVAAQVGIFMAWRVKT